MMKWPVSGTTTMSPLLESFARGSELAESAGLLRTTKGLSPVPVTARGRRFELRSHNP